jgi:hypothetical protein
MNCKQRTVHIHIVPTQSSFDILICHLFDYIDIFLSYTHSELKNKTIIKKRPSVMFG